MSKTEEAALALTRAILQRIARTLGVDPRLPTAELATQIETAVQVATAVRRLHGQPTMRCALCGDVDGPWGLRDGRLVCEGCEAILEPPPRTLQAIQGGKDQ